MTAVLGWIARRLCVLALGLATLAHAGSIEPKQAQLTPGDEGYTLSADFAVELGSRLEEAVTRGLPLYFNLEFVLERHRKYWINEHIATRTLGYRLAYSSLTRQYRLSTGSLHQNFASLGEALRVIGRIAALPVTEKNALRPGETYEAVVRLSLDRTQLPKPFQVDALTDREWHVEAPAYRWQFVAAAP